MLNNLWNLCQISAAKLSCPIVACELGRFYRKEAVIELLIDRNKLEGRFAPEIHEQCLHIRNMKDVTVRFFTYRILGLILFANSASYSCGLIIVN